MRLCGAAHAPARLLPLKCSTGSVAPAICLSGTRRFVNSSELIFRHPNLQNYAWHYRNRSRKIH